MNQFAHPITIAIAIAITISIAIWLMQNFAVNCRFITVLLLKLTHSITGKAL